MNRNLQPLQFETTGSWEGTEGNPRHITRRDEGFIPVSWVAHMHGREGELPGEHRNKQGTDWDRFKGDVAEHGVREPIHVMVDYYHEPRLSEGSHRRDAAVELGHTHIPAEVVYYGHAERQGTLQDRAGR
jgi:hypothetical protein